MPERLHPGVYIEEVSSGVRPIEGASTSTAAFIGKAEMGALNRAVLVTSLPEYQTKYGGFLNGFYLSHSVMQFFNNGGKKCYVVRVAGSGAASAEVAIRDRRAAPGKTITIRAANEGAWGNKLDVVVTDATADPDNEFALSIFKDRSDLTPPKPPLLLETHDNLSMDKTAANYVQKVIAANSQYIAAEVDLANLNNAVAGTSRSGRLAVGNGSAALGLTGGGAAAGVGVNSASWLGGPIVNPNPPADTRAFLISVNGETAKEVALPAAPNNPPTIAAAIQAAVRALVAANPANQPAYTNFTAAHDVPNNRFVLTSGMGSGSVAVTPSTTPLLTLAAGTYKFVITVNGDGPHEVTLSPGAPLATPEDVRNALQLAIAALTPKRFANVAAFTGFTVTYETGNDPNNPSLVFRSGAAGGNSSVRIVNASSNNVATTLKIGATNTGREINGTAALRPANSLSPTEYHLGDAVVGNNVVSILAGDDGQPPVGQDFKNGLPALDVIRDFSILAVPGIYDPDVVASGVNYCTQRIDCFFIGDCNPTDDTVAEAQTFVNGLTVKTSYGAVYYPWLKMSDPTGATTVPMLAPPSGFIAGVYARTDSRRGVWKAPAGTEANIGGAVGLAAETTDVQQDFLNPIGVNVIRSFPAAGIVIWGARTLATRSDPEWRYIPVRRTAIFLEQSIYSGIQWAVFEPNDEPLWASLRLNITAFMMLQFRAGAFQGRTPTEAFFVQCDGKTTTQADIDAGVVNILVGFAPLKPAEFVVLKLSQKVNQPAA
jgi:phage tail sheath protein FI